MCSLTLCLPLLTRQGVVLTHLLSVFRYRQSINPAARRRARPTAPGPSSSSSLSLSLSLAREGEGEVALALALSLDAV